MSKHKFGVSGSTILSNPEQFHELFWDDIDSIEIGEFPDETAFRAFLELSRAKQCPLAFIHRYYETEVNTTCFKKFQLNLRWHGSS